jgi:hypothetical protein
MDKNACCKLHNVKIYLYYRVYVINSFTIYINSHKCLHFFIKVCVFSERMRISYYGFYTLKAKLSLYRPGEFLRAPGG